MQAGYYREPQMRADHMFRGTLPVSGDFIADLPGLHIVVIIISVFVNGKEQEPAGLFSENSSGESRSEAVITWVNILVYIVTL